MKTEYEMTKEDLAEIKDACQPVPAILVAGLGGPMPRSPQENANAAWERLGDKMGFQHMTVELSDKGERFFKAVPRDDNG